MICKITGVEDSDCKKETCEKCYRLNMHLKIEAALINNGNKMKRNEASKKWHSEKTKRRFAWKEK